MLARYTMFSRSLANIASPPNTVADWELGADRGRSRNNLVARSLERGSEWILFLDDDHSFPPDLLTRLLAHNVPIVASLYLQRSDPFLPIAYVSKDAETGSYMPLDLNQCGQNDLVPVVGAGTGGMLIRSEVFHKLDPPWFVHTTQQSEDLYFGDRCVEAGIPIVVDLGAPLGHLTAMNVFPSWADEGEAQGWGAGLAISPTMHVVLPIVMPTDE